MVDDDYADRLIARLQPEEVIGNMLRIGIALTLYELLKSQVIDGVRDFFSTGFDETGWLYDEAAFDREVRSLDSRSVYRASLLWLEAHGAIDSGDADAVNHMHKYRQKLAHESGTLILDPNFEIEDDLIEHVRDALEKMARFWAQIEIETSGAIEASEMDDSEVVSPLVDFFDHIHTIERGYQQQLRTLKDGPSPEDAGGD